MVKLSDLVRAAEEADASLIQRAYAILIESVPERITTAEAEKLFRVSRRTILRHGTPVEKFAGQNMYDVEALREALRG